MNGYTYELTQGQLARNEFDTCLHFLRCSQEYKQGQYWFLRVCAAWKNLEEYATRSEYRLFLRILIDFALIDPDHRRYADPLVRDAHADTGEFRSLKWQ